jgi:hypothetical protein
MKKLLPCSSLAMAMGRVRRLESSFLDGRGSFINHGWPFTKDTGYSLKKEKEDNSGWPEWQARRADERQNTMRPAFALLDVDHGLRGGLTGDQQPAQS